MRHFYSEVFLELSRYFFDDLWSRPLRDWCDLVLTNKYYTPVIGYWTAIWFLVTSSILLPKIIIIDRRTSLQISAEKEHNLCCIRFKLSFSSKFTQFFPLKKSPRWKVKAILTRGEKTPGNLFQISCKFISLHRMPRDKRKQLHWHLIIPKRETGAKVIALWPNLVIIFCSKFTMNEFSFFNVISSWKSNYTFLYKEFIIY